MKKPISITSFLVLMAILCCGCSGQASSAATSDSAAPINAVYGQVVSIYGNQLTLNLGAYGAPNGEKPDGAMDEAGEMPSRPTSGEQGEGGAMNRPDANGEGGAVNRPSENTSGNKADNMMDGNADVASMIALTDEIVEYSIPVGTPVDVFGTAMTFSQIAADYYLAIELSEDGAIRAITILG